ncbi:YceK/YidQ family lipoprotein [Shewanella sp. SG41-3]|uniref:YceK/YidQ family lipoprotein n=1 Tax=Shewanella sp. SG41-3 TaxID=2760977 RepID=UPI001602E3C4|nr:YceK/YidQ family lipoprotein [Shewanella sp. SG41-3]MBB1476086.1 YceK/YidQ family lipoprotein [Shewanella sp. SG41-3]
MKGFTLILVALCTFSCATIKTIDPPQNHLNISQNGKKSYCEEIPRVYSGVSYNFCLLYGEPSKTVNLGGSVNKVPIIVFDTVFSVVSDTVVLPYTIKMQADKGSLKVN